MNGAVIAAPAPGAVASGAGRRLGRFVRPYRLTLAAAAALTLVQTALDLASPWPLKVIVDNAVGDKPLPAWLSFLGPLSPAWLAAAAAAAGVMLVTAAGVISYAITYWLGAAAERIGADLRSEVFARLQRLSLRFHDRNRTGDLVSRLTSDTGRVQDSLVAWFETVIPETLTLAGMFAVMLALDPALAFAALTVVPALAAYVGLSRPRIKAAQREARTRSGVLSSRATEVLRHVRAVQAFSRAEEEQRRFRSDSDAAADSAIGALAVSARLSPAADVILALGTGYVLWLGVAGVRSGRITLGALLVVLAYLSSVYGPIRSLSRLASTLARGAASRERLADILGAEELVGEHPHPLPAPPGALPVAVREVSFAYHAGQPVLHGVSLEAEPGETLCVAGPTGAGKSTLLALLLRLYDPDGGRIELAGTDVRRLSLRSLRERIALVPQDPWIVDGTIADNIAFVRSEAAGRLVRDAARLALVDEFAERLRDGYDTVVGEGGVMLSGGQRRRIALARALARDASVLLLDEPTSGLDAASEAMVMQALRRASHGRTVIMVTHRLGLSNEADRVLVLDGGRVVEDGPRDRLLSSGGPFARLWALQNGHGKVLWPQAAPAPQGRGLEYVEGR
jgi:ATP-binding cassette subfamily B protein